MRPVWKDAPLYEGADKTNNVIKQLNSGCYGKQIKSHVDYKHWRAKEWVLIIEQKAKNALPVNTREVTQEFFLVTLTQSDKQSEDAFVKVKITHITIMRIVCLPMTAANFGSLILDCDED
jgi:hypothetical protein